MVVTPLKKDVESIMQMLQIRIDNLRDCMRGRDLKHPSEGVVGKGHWNKPELRTAIEKIELEIAVDDFKTVLAQIRKIK